MHYLRAQEAEEMIALIDPFNFLSFAIQGNLTINGNVTTITRLKATSDSIPVRSRVTIVAATLERLGDAIGVAYTPAVPGDWLVVPTTVQEALDRIAAVLGPI